MEPLKRLVAEAFCRWVRVPLEALFQTARDGGFPFISNGFQTFLIHSNSLQITSFLCKTWAKCGHGIAVGLM